MLPTDATEHSKLLFDFAVSLIAACPPALYDEAAVSGSVARGRADPFSDCEITFLLETLQDASVYKAWLESLGEQPTLMRETLYANQPLYLEYLIDGVEVCTIWQTWDQIEEIFTALADDHLPPYPPGPWMVSHLVPMGAAPRLQRYQALVQIYPDALRRNVIEGELRFWRWKIGVPALFLAEAAAHRRQLVDLRTRQMQNIASILTILFAYNREWIPERKWYGECSQALAHKPPDLIQTMDRLLTSDDPAFLLPTMRSLMVEMLRIIANEFPVDDLIVTLEAYTFTAI